MQVSYSFNFVLEIDRTYLRMSTGFFFSTKSQSNNQVNWPTLSLTIDPIEENSPQQTLNIIKWNIEAQISKLNPTSLIQGAPSPGRCLGTQGGPSRLPQASSLLMHYSQILVTTLGFIFWHSWNKIINDPTAQLRLFHVRSSDLLRFPWPLAHGWAPLRRQVLHSNRGRRHLIHLKSNCFAFVVVHWVAL